MGGFDLAAEWMGWNNVAHCEWNPFCQQILKYYWPKAISYEDITKTDFTKFRNTIDVLSGGFPCQGNSLAGSRLGTDDDRYLWPEMLRVIDETQPVTVVGENVTGILSVEDRTGIYRDIFAKVENRTITRFHEVDHYEAIYTRQAKMLVNSICEDLEKRGYEVQTFAIPAASVGAPHQRERIWFVAHSSSYRRSRCRKRIEVKNRESESGNTGIMERRLEGLCLQRNASYPSSGRLEGFWNCGLYSSEKYSKSQGFGSEWLTTYSNGIRLRGQSDGIRESRFFNQEGKIYDWANFPTQSPICDGNDGISSKLDGITFSKWRNESIKAGGNAIVPQVALQIFKAIKKYSE
jgi:DNA (cytosine-5)-methyltransferase 1